MMPLLMKTISIMLLLVFILSVALLILTFRKPKKISVLSMFLAIFMSLVTLTVFSFLIRYHPSIWLLVAMGSIGLFIGIVWSQTTRIYIEKGSVMSHNSVWYLVAWGSIFALTQLISIVTNKPPSVMIALLIMSTGSVIGMNGRIIRRYFVVRAGIGAPETAFHNCRQCGATVDSGNAFCNQCGAKL